MTTVLVTGYGGFLGQAIACQLLASGYQVRGLARSNYPHLQAMGVEPYAGSVTDRSAIAQAVSGCDAIIHTAAVAGVWGPWSEYYETNTLGTQCLLDSAIAAGCQAFVYTSSPSVTFAAEHQSGIDETVPYPKRWLCHYPHTKAIAEQSVMAAAQCGRLWTAALRPHLIWGNGDPHLLPRVVKRAQQGALKRVGTGQNLIDIVHVDHAATAHLLALEKLLAQDSNVNGQAFFITDGQPIACWQWISDILTHANVKVPQSGISFSMAYRIGAILEFVYSTLRIRSEPRMTRFVAAQLALDHYFSIDKARRLLGYAPLPIREKTLQECEPWLRSLKS